MRTCVPLLTVLLLSGVGPAANADERAAAACSADAVHQFDFWIGDWVVTENGTPAGTNHIERILDGCALLENWQGAKGGAGKSLNFYDRDDQRWHQTWIDHSGGALFLSGTYANGAMRMEGERAATATQPATRHRITWTPLPDGAVRQLWESTPSGKTEWVVLFDGLYQRVPHSPK